MNLASAIEGGITGASTLTLLQEAIGKIDTKRPPSGLLRKPGLLRKIKKASKKGKYPAELYIRLATDLLSSAAYYGITAVGKKNNAMLRGGLLGAAAGIGSAFFNYDSDKPAMTRDDMLKAALEIALYTSGGLLAGAAVQNMGKLKKKKKK